MADEERAAGGRRIAEIDVLRGFALFGILVTNALVGTMLMSFTGTADNPAPMFDGGVDRVVYAVMYGLFLGKFYLLFAFLFGYSFTLQIAAAERAGARPVPRLLRRSGALFLIGLAHVLFLWIGDILTLYAILCVILVLLRKIRPRTALITGVTLYLLYVALSFFTGGGGVAGLGELLDLPRMHTGYTGDFGETLRIQLETAPIFMLFTWLGQGVPSLAMFLLGLAAGKRRLFEDRELLNRWTPIALKVGFAVGLPVSLITTAFWSIEGRAPDVLHGLQELANPFMTLGYVAAVVWLTRWRWASPITDLAPAGKMAATNYITQSLIFALIYTGYGLSLADRLPPWAVLAVALLTYALQLRASTRWLRTHPYGPVEWLLRAATYRTLPPWLRQPVRVSEPA
ncbi:DUF418 domain-containing protein [Nocardia sp. NPDC005978]|uniref:DUF418 domain-containing protein n=1 Tax=Nocardia sp. NPDC005978 TaxID=3156725 RepID=UPI00339E4972